MVFRRRDRRGIARAVWEIVYPKGGWSRAYLYVKHRLTRLPGTPEQIARGIAVGVFAAFSPLYGLHFLVAAVVALLIRGSVIAALLGTFFGNPLTYIPIGAASVGAGYAILGKSIHVNVYGGFGQMFSQALWELWFNFTAIFTVSVADWTYLSEFWDTVFFPWLVGSIPVGVIAGLLAYLLSAPTIRAYKNRRKGLLSSKLIALRKKAQNKRDERLGR